MFQIIKKYIVPIALVSGFSLVVFGTFIYSYLMPCVSIAVTEPSQGSQGYRTWFSESIQSFTHHGEKICVDDVWMPVGAIQQGDGWARFEKEKTGVLVRKVDFDETQLSFENTNYHITLLYPHALPKNELAEYVQTISNAFSRVGKIFNDKKTITPREHTVLITAGIAHTELGESIVIYPDPTERVTIFFRPLATIRGEELFIHAVTHLYNRFRSDLTKYEKNQSPLKAEDFQELEATWAEIAFRSSSQGRINRLNYLYNVHLAVQTKNFNLITEAPFDDKEAFDLIKPTVLVTDNSSYLDTQYGHYVLGPLIMVAIDGLLSQANAPVNLEDLLTEIHKQPNENLFDALARNLEQSDIESLKSWMFGGVTIPSELIQTAIHYYEQ